MLQIRAERLPREAGMLRLGAESQHISREQSLNPADS